MYLIYKHKETKKGKNIRGAELIRVNGETTENVLAFYAPTENGWLSKKPIIADFDFVATSDGYACEVLEISDEVAERLIAQYKGLTVKVYQSYADRQAAAMADLCQYLQPDTISSHG